LTEEFGGHGTGDQVPCPPFSRSLYLQGGKPKRLAVVVVEPAIDGLGPVSGGVSVDVGGLKNTGALGRGAEILVPAGEPTVADAGDPKLLVVDGEPTVLDVAVGEPMVLDDVEVESVESDAAASGCPIDDDDENDDDENDDDENDDGAVVVASVDGVANADGADNVDGVDNVDPNVLLGVSALPEAGTHGIDGCPSKPGDVMTGAVWVVLIGGFIGFGSVGDWVC
jgi:hypothetical protein